MEKRTWISIVVCLIVSTAAGWVTYRSSRGGDVVKKKERPLQVISKESVATLEISGPSGKDKVLLMSGANGWSLAEPLQSSAEQGLVSPMLDELSSMQFVEVTSHSKDQFGALGVSDDHGIHVVAKDGTGRVLADLWLGNMVANSMMLRVEGKEQVWKVSGIRRRTFEYGPKDLRDHQVTKVELDRLQRFTLEGGGKVATFEQVPRSKDAPSGAESSRHWRLIPSESSIGTSGEKKAPSEAEVDHDLLSHVISSFSNLRADDFDDLGTDAHLADVGLASPLLRVTLVDEKNQKTELWVSAPLSGKYYVKRADQSQVYVLEPGRKNDVYFLPTDLLDKTIVAIPEKDYSRISIEKENSQLLIQKTEKGFSVESIQRTEKGMAAKPIEDLDEERVQRMLPRLLKISGVRFVQNDDPALTSLKTPRATVSIEQQRGAKLVFQIGASVDGDCVVGREGLAPVFVHCNVIEPFLRGPDYWKKLKAPPQGSPTPGFVPPR